MRRSLSSLGFERFETIFMRRFHTASTDSIMRDIVMMRDAEQRLGESGLVVM